MRALSLLASLAVLTALAPVSPVLAADSSGELLVKVQIPRLQVAEYHRPYIAIWIEGADQGITRHLAVWYQTDPNKEDGTKWLKDLRQWWRRGGRAQTMPIDGVTGATRPAGEHTMTFSGEGLAPGSYHLAVEASREVGGRELLRLPFTWPVSQRQETQVQGKTELGAVTLEVTPAS